MSEKSEKVRRNIKAILEKLAGMKSISSGGSLYEGNGIRVCFASRTAPDKSGKNFDKYTYNIKEKTYEAFLSRSALSTCESKCEDYVLFLLGDENGVPEKLYLIPSDFLADDNIKKRPYKSEYKFDIKVYYDNVFDLGNGMRFYGTPGVSHLVEEDKFPKTDIDSKYSLSIDELPEKLLSLMDDSRAPFEEETAKAVDFCESESHESKRVRYEAYRPLRDTKLSRMVKELHQFKCQICGFTILFASGERYAEAHHIKPISRPHNGPDTMSNIVCVCPNHHAMLDYGAIELDKSKLKTVPGHIISDEYINYHNGEIFGKY